MLSLAPSCCCDRSYGRINEGFKTVRSMCPTRPRKRPSLRGRLQGWNSREPPNLLLATLKTRNGRRWSFVEVEGSRQCNCSLAGVCWTIGPQREMRKVGVRKKALSLGWFLFRRLRLVLCHDLSLDGTRLCILVTGDKRRIEVQLLLAPGYKKCGLRAGHFVSETLGLGRGNCCF